MNSKSVVPVLLSAALLFGASACSFSVAEPESTSTSTSDLYGVHATCVEPQFRSIAAQGQDPRVNCAMFEMKAGTTFTQDEDCADVEGREVLDYGTRRRVRAKFSASTGGTELASRQLCGVHRISVPRGQSCVGGHTKGWCYVEGKGRTLSGQSCDRALVIQEQTLRDGVGIYSLCEPWL